MICDRATYKQNVSLLLSRVIKRIIGFGCFAAENLIYAMSGNVWSVRSKWDCDKVFAIYNCCWVVSPYNCCCLIVHRRFWIDQIRHFVKKSHIQLKCSEQFLTIRQWPQYILRKENSYSNGKRIMIIAHLDQSVCGWRVRLTQCVVFIFDSGFLHSPVYFMIEF